MELRRIVHPESNLFCVCDKLDNETWLWEIWVPRGGAYKYETENGISSRVVNVFDV